MYIHHVSHSANAQYINHPHTDALTLLCSSIMTVPSSSSLEGGTYLARAGNEGTQSPPVFCI